MKKQKNTLSSRANMGFFSFSKIILVVSTLFLSSCLPNKYYVMERVPLDLYIPSINIHEVKYEILEQNGTLYACLTETEYNKLDYNIDSLITLIKIQKSAIEKYKEYYENSSYETKD